MTKKMDVKNAWDNKECISKIAKDFIGTIFSDAYVNVYSDTKGFLHRQEERKNITLPPITDQGKAIEEAVQSEIALLEQDANLRHPRYYGFIPGPAQSISWLGDMIASAYNSHVGGWHLGPGASKMEKAVIDWALEKTGLSNFPTAGGILSSGGSMAIFTALAAARDHKISLEDLSKATVYLTDQTHTANHKALHLIGISRHNWRYIETKNYQMNVTKLESQIEEDIKKGLIPFLIIGTCGTTNTGSIDPLAAIAEISQKYNLWFHVDAAYGGSVMLSKEKERAHGIEKADSIAWDGHKWLYQTYGVAFCLMKDKRCLLHTYTVGGEYLQDLEGGGIEPDWWDLGPELTRPARGARLWLSLQTIGNIRLSSMINNSIANAEWFEKQIVNSDFLELVTKASLAILTFRVKAKTDQESMKKNIMLAEKLRKDNIAGIFTTELDGKNVLRLCTISPFGTIEDFQDLFDRMADILQNES